MPENAATHPTRLHGLAEWLCQDRLLSMDAAHQAIHEAAQKCIPLVSYLVQSGRLSSQQIFDCCRRHVDLPHFDLQYPEKNHSEPSLVSPELMLRYHVMPVKQEQHTLYLALSDPGDYTAISAISFHTGLQIQPVLVSEAELHKTLKKHCQTPELTSHLETALLQLSSEEQDASFTVSETDDNPVGEFADQLLQDAIEKKVSDIHIEPFSQHCRIRFRRDGLLYEAANIPSRLAARLTARFKVMSQLDIAERRLPQDGHIQTHHSQVDIRISTCPTRFGEKLVLRILDPNNLKLDIHTLGMTETQKTLFLDTLSQPQGIILVTGPTGSGKTVTLYSALHYLNQIEKNILSVEDPVEMEVEGINQININPRIGLDFPAILRALLRQDPDIIMIGEIRDMETARIAIQAAQTGHLVLSTLHTNNAVEAIARLQSMGILADHFIHAVSLLIAQRLVRQLCLHCKQPSGLTKRCDDYATRSAQPVYRVYRAIGCEKCCNGYIGRIGIFECIPMTENISHSILSGTSVTEIMKTIKQENRMLLREAGLEKVKAGTTSYQEIQRVMGKK